MLPSALPLPPLSDPLSTTLAEQPPVPNPEPNLEPPKFTRTDLPPELWLEVFRNATYVPRSRGLAHGDPFAPERLPNFAWGVNTPILSNRTKCTLVRVCSEWRKMATELLYEHVVITSIRRAKLIIRTFQQSGGGAPAQGSNKRSSASMEDEADATKSGTSPENAIKIVSTGHGQWVRHLEVRPCTRNSSNSIPFLNLVAYILVLCPNLQSFSGAWTDNVPRGFLFVIMKYHGATLQGLQWEQTIQAFSKEISNPNTTVLSPQFLSAFQRLRVLDLRTLANLAIPNFNFNDADLADASSSSAQSSSDKGDSKPKITLPYLTNLRLPVTSVVIQFASTLSLPNLHSLTLDVSQACAVTAHSLTTLPPALHDPLHAFLQVHGPLITTLELIPFTSTTYKPSPFPLSPALFLQPDTCPNLRTLIFDCRERPVVSPAAYDTLGPSSKHKLPPVSTSLDPLANPSGQTNIPPAVLSSMMRLPLGEDKQVMTAPHLNLSKIGIRGLGISRLYPNKPSHTQNHLRALIGARASGLLPRLEKVQSIGFLVDASTDTFARDIFIWWTERFEDVGIDLVDGEGVVWLYEDEKEEDKKGKQKEKPKGKGEEKEPEGGDNESKDEEASDEEKARTTEVGETEREKMDSEDTKKDDTTNTTDAASTKETSDKLDAPQTEESYATITSHPSNRVNYVHKTDPKELATKRLRQF